MIPVPLTPQQRRQRDLAARLRAIGARYPGLTVALKCQTILNVTHSKSIDLNDFESTDLAELFLSLLEQVAAHVERGGSP